MKAADLHKLWSSPDNSKLTSKQYSFRLPVHVAAKIQALCDMYPNKNRTEIVGDLLSSALHEVEQGLPSYDNHCYPVDHVPGTGEILYDQMGPGVDFRNLTEKYIKELEAESKSNVVSLADSKNPDE